MKKCLQEATGVASFELDAICSHPFASWRLVKWKWLDGFQVNVPSRSHRQSVSRFTDACLVCARFMLTIRYQWNFPFSPICCYSSKSHQMGFEKTASFLAGNSWQCLKKIKIPKACLLADLEARWINSSCFSTKTQCWPVFCRVPSVTPLIVD